MTVRLIYLGAIISICALAVGCTQQPDKIADTYWPETVIRAEREAVSDTIIGKLSSTSAVLEESSETLLQFSAPYEGTQADMMNMFLGSGFSEAPRGMMNFILTERPGETRVVLQFWSKVQQANGSWKRFESRENNHNWNAMQEMLWRIKDSLEGG